MTETIHENNEDTEQYAASQWLLIWWKFRKHRLAMGAGAVILWLYLITIFCEVLAPYTLESYKIDFAYAPPQRLRIFSEEGRSPPTVCLWLEGRS